MRRRSRMSKEIFASMRQNVDVLSDNFRNDIICEALLTFKDKEVRLMKLLRFAKELGDNVAIYPWSYEYDRLRYNVNRRFIAFSLYLIIHMNDKLI